MYLLMRPVLKKPHITQKWIYAIDVFPIGKFKSRQNIFFIADNVLLLR